MKIFGLVLFSLFIFAGCGQRGNSSAKEQAARDTAKYYSLESFYREQREYVELRDFPMYRIRTVNRQKDSAAFSKDDFSALVAHLFPAQSFLPGEKAMYKETVFEDQSTDSYTLNYTATDSAPAVRSIDILLDRASNTVKRVFVKSLYKSGGDTTVEQMFGLKAFKSMQLNRTITAKGYQATELNYINWNDKH